MLLSWSKESCDQSNPGLADLADLDTAAGALRWHELPICWPTDPGSILIISVLDKVA